MATDPPTAHRPREPGGRNAANVTEAEQAG